MAAILVTGGWLDRIVACLEVDAPEPGAGFLVQALQNGVADAVADGHPESHEDGGALHIAEGVDAE